MKQKTNFLPRSGLRKKITQDYRLTSSKKMNERAILSKEKQKTMVIAIIAAQNHEG
ncbi:MAG: hypothetical protein PF694_06190 [Bacteroidetes bacterium]|jgi:hypothetical protein|nr:hypothetical protein [Bacteroidota bacterium]